MTDQVEITKHVDRRAIVRTAAHAAWAIPAIQIATTVSASAATCSGGTQPTAFSMTGNSVKSATDNKVWTGTYVVTNTGASDTATVQVTASGGAVATPPSASGWARTGTGPWLFSKVFGDCVAGPASENLNFSLTYGSANAKNSVSAVLI